MDYYELKIFTTTNGVGIITALLEGHGVSGTCVDDPKDALDLLNKKHSYDWDYFDPELINRSSDEAVITFYLEKAPEGLKLIRDILHEIETLKPDATGDDATDDDITADDAAGDDTAVDDITADNATVDEAAVDDATGDINIHSEPLCALGFFEGSHGFKTPASNAASYDFSLGSLRTECKLRSDEEWKDTWKAFFKPHLLVEGLWIRPGWEAFTPVNKGDIVLELDPGMAFGTGKHETTALCAGLMKESLKPGDRVLDVGCGSGILSVATALLGASEVLAVDIDEDAISVTRENIARNNCGGVVRAVRGDLARGIDFKSDVILANLTVDLIVELLGHVKNNMKKNAVFIVSGVLTDKRSKVKNAFHTSGFHIIEERIDGEWCALSARVEV